ncbi:MAG: DUF736 domain-containing protein [Alphaproteobacteria bacterium]|nr:DUF736 domain-containing protein [Alphaproteobacteria bacterium]
MIIGTFDKDGEGFYGKIKTMMLSIPVSIKSVKRNGDNSPTHRVISKSQSGTEIGAAWERDSQHGNSYVSVKLDCPSLPQPINCNLIEKDGKYLLLWERQ